LPADLLPVILRERLGHRDQRVERNDRAGLFRELAEVCLTSEDDCVGVDIAAICHKPWLDPRLVVENGGLFVDLAALLLDRPGKPANESTGVDHGGSWVKDAAERLRHPDTLGDLLRVEWLRILGETHTLVGTQPALDGWYLMRTTRHSDRPRLLLV